MWTAGWLGRGTTFLLSRTRFGYTFAVCLLLAGVFTLLTQKKFDYPGAGSAPILYLIGAVVLAVAVAVETYFQNNRWPALAGAAVIGTTILSIVLMATTTLAAPGYALDPATGAPTGELFPGTIRLLTPFMNITGGFALALGALFTAYVFMPKKRVLAYSLDETAPGDQYLFNLLISIVAIVVNFVASLPRAIRALFAGKLHSRVPATILIAIGGFLASGGDALNRFGVTNYFEVREVPGRPVPLRRLPRLDRGVPRDPDPVHLRRAPPGAERAGGRDTPARRCAVGAGGRRGWSGRRVRLTFGPASARTMPRCVTGGCCSAP
jgi:hypothetical protein